MGYGQCWLCGRNGMSDPLDSHHIFGGSNRKKSDRLGLVVRLCHFRCHLSGKQAVHRDSETAQRLHEYGQRMAMERMDWTTEDFIREFGRNYIEDTGREESTDEGEYSDCDFFIQEDMLPY